MNNGKITSKLLSYTRHVSVITRVIIGLDDLIITGSNERHLSNLESALESALERMSGMGTKLVNKEL